MPLLVVDAAINRTRAHLHDAQLYRKLVPARKYFPNARSMEYELDANGVGSGGPMIGGLIAAVLCPPQHTSQVPDARDGFLLILSRLRVPPVETR